MWEGKVCERFFEMGAWVVCKMGFEIFLFPLSVCAYRYSCTKISWISHQGRSDSQRQRNFFFFSNENQYDVSAD